MFRATYLSQKKSFAIFKEKFHFLVEKILV